MRRLAALAFAGAACATPAHAVIAPVCATALTHAATGTTTSCATDNTPMVSGATVHRYATLVVLTGSARATLSCAFGHTSDSVVVVGSGTGTAELLEDFSPSCRVELTALSPTTTAVVTSTFSYDFIQPGA